MVFQQGALFEWLTVAENVNFVLIMKKKDPIETQKKVDEWLEIVGLKGFGNTPTYQLSGGMQQRVALARCLINDPDLILMDEPLGALDALTREKMQSLVLKIWKETGKTIILITPFKFLLKAKGSDDPLGRLPEINILIKVSTLSAIETIAPYFVEGKASL